MTSYAKQAVTGATVIFVVSLLAAGLGYLVRIILAHNLTIEDFGLFYAMFSFLGLLGIFKGFGFDKAVVKFIPDFVHEKNTGHLNSLIVYAGVIQFITNCIILLLLYLCSSFLATEYFKSSQAEIMLLWMALAFFIDAFMQLLRFCFQGFLKPVSFAIIDLLRMALIVALCGLGFLYSSSIIIPILAYIITPTILLLIFGVYFFAQVHKQFSWKSVSWDPKLFKKIGVYGIFTVGAGLSSIILGYTDMVMLTSYTDLTQVALYSVALPTARVLLYFPRSINNVLLPLSSSLWAKKKIEVLSQGMQSIYKYGFVAMIPLGLILFSFTDIILNVLYGKEFIHAATAMKILVVSMLLHIVLGPNNNFLAGIGKVKTVGKIIFGGAIINVIANAFLIPTYGIIGAAIATSCSLLVMTLLSIVEVRRCIKVIIPLRHWVLSIVAGILFTICIGALKSWFVLHWLTEMIIVVSLASVAYAGLVYVFKIISVGEIKHWIQRIR